MTNYTPNKKYKHSNDDRSTVPFLLPLEELIIDERIAEMIEKNNQVFPPELNNNLYDYGTVPLNQVRLDNILKGYKSSTSSTSSTSSASFSGLVPLPPIEIKYNSFNGKYEVLNGRHRICASIMLKNKIIYCLIIKNMSDLKDDDNCDNCDNCDNIPGLIDVL